MDYQCIFVHCHTHLKLALLLHKTATAKYILHGTVNYNDKRTLHLTEKKLQKIHSYSLPILKWWREEDCGLSMHSKFNSFPKLSIDLRYQFLVHQFCCFKKLVFLMLVRKTQYRVANKDQVILTGYNLNFLAFFEYQLLYHTCVGVST